MITIQVKSEDIAAGDPCNSWSNPVCLAIRRDAQISDHVPVVVREDSCRIGRCKPELPAEVYAWLDKLDTEGKKHVQPMTFQLDI